MNFDEQAEWLVNAILSDERAQLLFWAGYSFGLEDGHREAGHRAEQYAADFAAYLGPAPSPDIPFNITPLPRERDTSADTSGYTRQEKDAA